MKIDIFNSEEKYDILYTEPPWQQGRGGKKSARPNSTGMAVPYETMDIPEIMELHRHVTNSLMNEKNNVFMWTIDKYLPEAERIMEMLGYKLHARIIWDKVNGPSPAYTLRFSHEYLLWFFKKGNIVLPDKSQRGAFTTVLRESSRKHSQKPEAAYQMLEALFPGAKKLELFARTERDGWDQWGNEL
jgi:N6-adenosine-specific RNA methylase IME4